MKHSTKVFLQLSCAPCLPCHVWVKKPFELLSNSGSGLAILVLLWCSFTACLCRVSVLLSSFIAMLLAGPEIEPCPYSRCTGACTHRNHCHSQGDWECRVSVQKVESSCGTLHHSSPSWPKSQVCLHCDMLCQQVSLPSLSYAMWRQKIDALNIPKRQCVECLQVPLDSMNVVIEASIVYLSQQTVWSNVVHEQRSNAYKQHLPIMKCEKFIISCRDWLLRTHRCSKTAVSASVDDSKLGIGQSSFQQVTTGCLPILAWEDLAHSMLTDWLYRCAAYLKMEQYENAVSDASTAVNLDGSNAKPYHRRAIAQMHLGKLDLAVPDFLKASHYTCIKMQLSILMAFGQSFAWQKCDVLHSLLPSTPDQR